MERASKDSEIARLRALLNDREACIACQSERIEELLCSSSWRITAPLRLWTNTLRNLRARFNRTSWSGSYRRWIRRYDTLDATTRFRLASEAQTFASPPLISVLMPVYNPVPRLLDEAIRSVRDQIYQRWQLCIADDASTDPAVMRVIRKHATAEPRIAVVQRTHNGHISRASNSALELAEGEFIALLDHDDVLAPHALHYTALAIVTHPNAELIYSDEDKITCSGVRFDPHFKCTFNRELLLAQNVVSHLGAYRRSTVVQLGGFREGYEGSQDWDLALRVTADLAPTQIVHIPRILYHWRASPGSTATGNAAKDYAARAGRSAVSDHLRAAGVQAVVSPSPELSSANMVRYELPSPAPLASILVPTRDRGLFLRKCLSSVLRKTTYQPFEILVIDNETTEPASLAYLGSVDDCRVRVMRVPGDFNFSALNNAAAAQARGDVLVLLNNDVEVLTSGWLEELVSLAMQPDVGAVGARLWYPGGRRLQHGGVLLGIGPVAAHAHHRLERGRPGYFGRAVLRQEFSAVTAACLAVRKQLYLEQGGLDERLPVTGNDIDFCLRLRTAGYRNIWTPHAELIHHESLSRGADDTTQKHIRASMEHRIMRQRWSSWLDSDPAYSPNLTRLRTDFSLAWPPQTPPIP